MGDHGHISTKTGGDEGAGKIHHPDGNHIRGFPGTFHLRSTILKKNYLV
jgi:hypothetical protein